MRVDPDFTVKQLLGGDDFGVWRHRDAFGVLWFSIYRDRWL